MHLSGDRRSFTRQDSTVVKIVEVDFLQRRPLVSVSVLLVLLVFALKIATTTAVFVLQKA